MGVKSILGIIFLCFSIVCNAQDEYYTVELPVTYSQITKDFLLGKTEYGTHPNFIVIDKKYTDLSPQNACIQKKTYAAFKKMYEAALKDGIELKITSASRNYYIQRIIWEQKWVVSNVPAGGARVKEILKYNAIPGTSRHHWGTELDLMSPKLAFWSSEKGKKVYKWLQENAAKFGFYQPYTSHNNRTGYQEEKWHWSYAPLSRIYTSAYRKTVVLKDLKGFVGDMYINDIDLIENYVFGITLPT